ncbi:MAG TPA: VOC family protein [Actinomycetota bacterium]|nr:VOC family protein [Actinomycetota bacterium]
MDFRLELVQVPVSDVDRAKSFYVDQAGFHCDVDVAVHEALRFVQLTPPGSSCSICIGLGITGMAPGSIEGLQLVVDDINQARMDLASRGCPVSEVEIMPWGQFVNFNDPDGNRWAVQYIPPESRRAQ